MDSTLLEAAHACDAERCLALLRLPSTSVNAKVHAAKAGECLEWAEEGATVLHLALLNDLDEVAAAILARSDFTERGTSMVTDETALHIAAALGKTSALRELLRTATTEELNARDGLSYMALHLAVRGLHIECVAELLSRQDLLRDATDRHGNRALDQAEGRSDSSAGRAIRLLLIGAGAPQKTHVLIVEKPEVPREAAGMPDDMQKLAVVFQSLRCRDGSPMGEGGLSEAADAASGMQAGSSADFEPQTTQSQRRTRRGRGGQRRWAAMQSQQSGMTEQPDDLSIPDTASDLFFPKAD